MAPEGASSSQQSEEQIGVKENDLRRLLEAMVLQNERKHEETEGHQSTKALQAAVNKLGRFDGRNITKYLRAYAQDMELHRVKDSAMISSFELAVVPEIRGRIVDLRKQQVFNDWEDFTVLLKEEFFDDDVERVTKRTFLEWIDAEPGKTKTPTEVLREFDQKYCQLTPAERLVLDTRKTELFMQAVDEATADKLWILLADKAQQDGLTTNWKKVEESVGILNKQRRGRMRGSFSGSETPSSITSTPGSSTPVQTVSKASASESVMDQVMRGIRDLQIDMVEIKRAQNILQTNPPRASGFVGGQPKPFVKKCIFCDSVEHQRLFECDVFDDYKKRGIVAYKEGRVRFASSDLEVEPNWNKGGMRKLIDDQIAASSAMHVTDAHSYNIEAVRVGNGSLSMTRREEMIRGAEAIRKLTGWDAPVEATCIKVYFDQQTMDRDAAVEDKRRRTSEDENVESVPKKKAAPSTSRTQHSPEPMEESAPQTRGEKAKEKEAKEKEAASKAKGKSKTPAYKLQSDIEITTDLKEILEERILSSKIEFTLREALGIAKRDFHELIIDVIKRKRQMTAETIMIKALDTTVSREEDEEIGKVFSQMHASSKGVSIDHMEPQPADCGLQAANVSNMSFDEVEKAMKKNKGYYTNPYWARATTETRVRLNDLKEHIRALVDHGSEVNILSRDVYEKGGWPIDLSHGWMLKGANNTKGELYGACPAVRTKIGDVEVEQNFFVQESSSYPIILGQPYITATRMETKVFDDGSHWAKIRSGDGIRVVQFLTVVPNHERNRTELRDNPALNEDGFLDF